MNKMLSKEDQDIRRKFVQVQIHKKLLVDSAKILIPTFSNKEIQPVWDTILHATHFFLGPVFCKTNEKYPSLSFTTLTIHATMATK